MNPADLQYYGPSVRKVMAGIGIGLLSFVILGTVAALWPNPFFIRMVPTRGYEVPVLAAQSALLGLYFVVRRPSCGVRMMGASSVINFLGVACPICNKILLLVFGATALLTYFEPVRLYVGIIGIGMGLLAVAIQVVPRWRVRAPISDRNQTMIIPW